MGGGWGCSCLRLPQGRWQLLAATSGLLWAFVGRASAGQPQGRVGGWAARFQNTQPGVCFFQKMFSASRRNLCPGQTQVATPLGGPSPYPSTRVFRVKTKPARSAGSIVWPQLAENPAGPNYADRTQPGLSSSLPACQPGGCRRCKLSQRPRIPEFPATARPATPSHPC